jgi:hypothetical protein
VSVGRGRGDLFRGFTGSLRLTRYISSLGMILASSPTLNPLVKETDKDVSGALAGFCLTAGLAVGSMMSFLVRWIVRGG